MNANPILLQKKYARIVKKLAITENISIQTALDIFYNSNTYKLMSRGISDMHCMSDEYLVEEILNEVKEKNG